MSNSPEIRLRTKMTMHSGSIASSSFARKALNALADPALIKARALLESGDFARAGQRLDELLTADSANPIILNLRAEVELRQNRHLDAVPWFERCLAVSPDFPSALHGLAYCLFHLTRIGEAMELADRMLVLDPLSLPARLLKGAVSALAGDNADAALIYQGVLGERPGHFPSLLGLGHSLRIIGRTDESIATYHEAQRVSPSSCEPWSCLASLKTYRFSEEELATMLRLDGRRDLPDVERHHLSFALGRAFWERGEDEAAFTHYSRGKVLSRAQAREDLELAAATVERWIDRTITAFAAPVDPHPQPTSTPIPIFVVGLPRSGTTLVEQIIGAHSNAEAAGELPHLQTIARRLMAQDADLAAIDRKAIGAEYLKAIAIHRKTDKPFLIDKQPTNFRNVALIRAVLPQARIVDVRRHPLANCVAMMRQNFLNLPEYAGTITDLAKSRLAYVRAMQSFEEALPGAVVPIRYEDLVNDPEAQIRRLIAALGLEFEEACLNSHKSGQPVRTPSSEQVRQPIYRSALEEWRRFEPWLDEVKMLLADELAEW